MDLRPKKAQLCGCGRRGCLETFASKSGLLGFLRARHPQPGPATAALDRLAPDWRAAMVGSKALKQAAKTDAAVDKAGCPSPFFSLFSSLLFSLPPPLTALQALERAARALGAAAANVLTTTGCEAVVLGGGLVEEMGRSLWPRVMAAVHEHSFAGDALAPLVRRTALGDLAVAVGAAAYCRRKHQAEQA